MTAPHGRFVAYTGRWRIVLASTSDGDGAIAALRSLLVNVLAGLTDAGGPLIGHIKLLADAGAAGHVAMSVTRYDEVPRPKGELRGDPRALDLTLAAIVMDTRHDDLARIVENALPKELNPEWVGDTTGERQ